MKMSNTYLSLVLLSLIVLLSGCSDSAPTSVTSGTDQSEIEAWKAKEAEINANAEEEMKLDG